MLTVKLKDPKEELLWEDWVEHDWENDPNYRLFLKTSDERGFLTAFVKYEGCVEVTGYHDSWFHICDLRLFIKNLVQLNELCVEHFGQFGVWESLGKGE